MDKGIYNEDKVGNKILNSNVEQFSGTEPGWKSAQSSIEKIVWADWPKKISQPKIPRLQNIKNEAHELGKGEAKINESGSKPLNNNKEKNGLVKMRLY